VWLPTAVAWPACRARAAARSIRRARPAARRTWRRPPGRGDRAGRGVGRATAWVAAIAGLAAALAGGYTKLRLITGAGFNQGFTLAHLPVRGARAK
jgi:hypothetical protein